MLRSSAPLTFAFLSFVRARWGRSVMSSVVALFDRERVEKTHRTGGRGTQPRQTEIAKEIAGEIRAKVGRDCVDCG